MLAVRVPVRQPSDQLLQNIRVCVWSGFLRHLERCEGVATSDATPFHRPSMGVARGKKLACDAAMSTGGNAGVFEDVIWDTVDQIRQRLPLLFLSPSRQGLGVRILCLESGPSPERHALLQLF